MARSTSLPRPAFRPLSEFVDLSAFSVPAAADAVPRVNVNLHFYRWNYGALLAVAALFTAWQRPLFLLALLLSALCGVYLFHVRRTALMLGGRHVRRGELVGLYAAASLVAAVWSGGAAFAASTLIAATLVLAHAGLRQRSLKAKAVSVWVALRRDFSTKDDAVEDDDDEAALDDPELGRARSTGSHTHTRADGGGGGGGGNSSAQREQEILKDEQARFRSTFRADMKKKYSRK